MVGDEKEQINKNSNWAYRLLPANFKTSGSEEEASCVGEVTESNFRPSGIAVSYCFFALFELQQTFKCVSFRIPPQRDHLPLRSKGLLGKVVCNRG
ncbi:hypothetical protein TNIN_103671 [Trichonephila inaurata madagascariensis]|uniref:Uncharacterized protein n=1 Tax=Trichonephila inaurata madagascariensis TaxID=2747483 RepID=A0A8X6WTJ2_9ARAC|nr:hypothetical protein TNIN_103671 [Trichonephila inaurata madagascariensis]